MHPRPQPVVVRILQLLAVVTLSACATTQTMRGDDASTRLLALLPMQSGFGPSDHDAYEARIAPIAAEHGMVSESIYTVAKFLGGAGPSEASSVGVWTLQAPGSLEGVMADPRYQGESALRDRIHDMKRTVMFLAQEEFAGAAPAPDHPLLVGALAMRPGFGFEEHSAYEAAVAPVAARHGMRLYRSFRVLKALGGASNIVAINIWELDSAEALSKVMADPEYVAKVEYRDRIHDMATTTMYLVNKRGGSR